MTSVLFLAFSALLLVVGYLDFARLKIPNELNLAFLGLFAVRWLLGDLQEPLSHHLLAMGVALAILFPLYAFRLLGGGDVKLLAVLALWLGWKLLLSLFVLVGLIGGGVTAIVLILRLLLRRFADNSRCPAALRRGAPIPYGIPIALAAWILHLTTATAMPL